MACLSSSVAALRASTTEGSSLMLTAAALAFTCSYLVAPIITQVTPSWCRGHALATSARAIPALSAMALQSPIVFQSKSSNPSSPCLLLELDLQLKWRVLQRNSEISEVLAYLPVKSPCIRGE